MSDSDGLCDYCGAYSDDMGNDLAKMVEDKFWCGQCRQGRDAQWGGLSTERIRDLAERAQAKYDADPIQWTKLPGESKVEDYQKHYQRLDLIDFAANMRQVLKDRGEDESAREAH